ALDGWPIGGPRHGAGDTVGAEVVPLSVPPAAGHVEAARRRAIGGEVALDAHLDVVFVAVGAVLDVLLVDGEPAVVVHAGLEPMPVERDGSVAVGAVGRVALDREAQAHVAVADQVDAQPQSLLGRPYEGRRLDVGAVTRPGAGTVGPDTRRRRRGDQRDRKSVAEGLSVA